MCFQCQVFKSMKRWGGVTDCTHSQNILGMSAQILAYLVICQIGALQRAVDEWRSWVIFKMAFVGGEYSCIWHTFALPRMLFFSCASIPIIFHCLIYISFKKRVFLRKGMFNFWLHSQLCISIKTILNQELI